MRTSRTEFKRQDVHRKSLEQEIVAFANKRGGRILFGVDDDKRIIGVEDTKKIERLILESAENVRPRPGVEHSTRSVDGKMLVLLEIPEGRHKPYAASDGRYFIRYGASKRRMSQEEILRAFQACGALHPEETPMERTGLDDINLLIFRDFCRKKFEEEIDLKNRENLKIALQNMHCYRENALTLLCVVLFCDAPQQFAPSCNIKAIAYEGIEDTGNIWRSFEEIGGNLTAQYKGAMNFIISNLPKLQVNKKSFNSPSRLPISKIALEETLVNALMHRDYLKQSPIRIFIFDDRVEIKSPGTLPNNLSVESIEYGTAVQKNPILCAYAASLLPYKGMGTGIRRAKKESPNIIFENREATEEFIVRIPLSAGERREEGKEPLPAEMATDVNLLTGNFNYLRVRLLDVDPSLRDALRSAEEAFNELGKTRERTVIIKSGALRRIELFMRNLEDTSSRMGKAFQKIAEEEVGLELKRQYEDILRRVFRAP